LHLAGQQKVSTVKLAVLRTFCMPPKNMLCRFQAQDQDIWLQSQASYCGWQKSNSEQKEKGQTYNLPSKQCQQEMNLTLSDKGHISIQLLPAHKILRLQNELLDTIMS